MDEIASLSISSPLLKRLSGDGFQTFRELYKNQVTERATAATMIICNPGSVPKLRLQDAAMADRLRELPYSEVPAEHRREDFKDIIETDEFKRALLARLVAAAAAETPREPPDAPKLVLDASANRCVRTLASWASSPSGSFRVPAR